MWSPYRLRRGPCSFQERQSCASPQSRIPRASRQSLAGPTHQADLGTLAPTLGRVTPLGLCSPAAVGTSAAPRVCERHCPQSVGGGPGPACQLLPPSPLRGPQPETWGGALLACWPTLRSQQAVKSHASCPSRCGFGVGRGQADQACSGFQEAPARMGHSLRLGQGSKMGAPRLRCPSPSPSISRRGVHVHTPACGPQRAGAHGRAQDWSADTRRDIPQLLLTCKVQGMSSKKLRFPPGRLSKSPPESWPTLGRRGSV